MTRDDDTDDMDLTPVEVETLLMLLKRGDDIPNNIAKETGRHRKSVSRKLSSLEDRGFVEGKGGGVYGLPSEGVLLAQALTREGHTL